jgi:hypothetical protein
MFNLTLSKFAITTLALSLFSIYAVEYKLDKTTHWQRNGGFIQYAPNILHGKGRIVAFSKDCFAYNPKKTYTLKGIYRQKPGSESNIFRIGIVPLDKDKKVIEYAYNNPLKNSDTVLLQAVNKSDTTIIVKNAANWNKRCFIAFNTKLDYSDLPNYNLLRQMPQKITKVANGWKITFAKAVNVSYKAGTPLRQQRNGSQYLYQATGTAGEVLGNIKCSRWAPGTKFFRVIILSGTDGIKLNENIPILEIINPAVEEK